MENPTNLEEPIQTEGPEQHPDPKPARKKLSPNILLLTIAAVVICFTLIFLNLPKKKAEPQIDVTVTLTKIVNTSDLATSVFQYQGIVEIPNQKKPEKIDYYICYDASVYAGIDFSQVKFTEDKANKTITATLPEVKILDTVVDPSSMDFMFQNKKADSISVTDVALTACETDIQQECTTDSALLDVARMNAENAIRALAEPVIQNIAPDHTLVIEDPVQEPADSTTAEEGSVNDET